MPRSRLLFLAAVFQKNKSFKKSPLFSSRRKPQKNIRNLGFDYLKSELQADLEVAHFIRIQ